MRISIFGLGYVGAVSLACLARDAHEVYGVDIDQTKLDLIRSGKSPVVEEGIQELTRAVIDSGRVQVTQDVAGAVRATDLSFVCVGTPPRRNGSQDLRAVLRLCEQLGAALAQKQEYHLIVIRSTVQPGTVKRIIIPALEQLSGKRAGEHFGVCFQPEFLREGTSIRDYDNPPFTVVGVSSERDIATMRALFGHLPCEFVVTSIANAELLKYACNAFHALKVGFANEIGRIAAALGVDGRDVMRLLCMDKSLNISSAYLRPGFAFGGSCLPKDLRALIHLARSHDADTPILASLMPSNELHIFHALHLVLDAGKRRVGLFGLAFKAGTDDLRESPLVALAEQLIGKGMQLTIYDPAVSLAHLIGSNRRFIEESIPHIGSLLTTSAESIVQGCDVIVIGMRSAEVLDAVVKHATPGHLIVDLVGVPEAAVLGAQYRGVCW